VRWHIIPGRVLRLGDLEEGSTAYETLQPGVRMVVERRWVPAKIWLFQAARSLKLTEL